MISLSFCVDVRVLRTGLFCFGLLRGLAFCFICMPSMIRLFSRCCYCWYRRGWCHKTCNTSYCFTTGLQGRWHAAVARLLLPHHYDFAGHTDSSFDSLSYISQLVSFAYERYCCIPHFGSFVACFGKYALARLHVYSALQCIDSECASSICFLYRFFDVSALRCFVSSVCWVSRAVLFLGHRVFPGVTQAEERRI